MIRVNSLRLEVGYGEHDLFEAVCRRLKASEDDIISLEPVRISLDARKKNDIHYVCSADVSVKNENAVLSNRKIKDITQSETVEYRDPSSESPLYEDLYYNDHPIVVGFGPAGMFCAYKMAMAGLKPIVIERGADVDTRITDVNSFWAGGPLKPDSNVQFGEGGAGTFSDGKLGTMIHDKAGRISEVYRILVENGADPSIRYMNKPHIGTDRLTVIVKNIRNAIIEHGGKVLFNSTLTGIDDSEEGAVKGIYINNREYIRCTRLVLAIGHSARDTFYMLHNKGIILERKPFAVGVRVQHPQEMIGLSQYGERYKELPAADYKLTCTTAAGRGVYSFCMCPGGFVVNASSEEGMLAVNGMSNSDRSEKTANSALVVTINEKDFQGDSPLAGIEFQREMEKLCCREGAGKIPAQYFGDFKAGKTTDTFHEMPNTKGAFTGGNVKNFLPAFISDSINEAMPSFGRSIKGFDRDDALFIGLESRTSSPVRIVRKETLESLSLFGLYPCGEGAGYAGGITSAAVDGIKVYEAVYNSYRTRMV